MCYKGKRGDVIGDISVHFCHFSAKEQLPLGDSFPHLQQGYSLDQVGSLPKHRSDCPHGNAVCASEQLGREGGLADLPHQPHTIHCDLRELGIHQRAISLWKLNLLRKENASVGDRMEQNVGMCEKGLALCKEIHILWHLPAWVLPPLRAIISRKSRHH